MENPFAIALCGIDSNPIDYLGFDKRFRATTLSLACGSVALSIL